MRDIAAVYRSGDWRFSGGYVLLLAMLGKLLTLGPLHWRRTRLDTHMLRIISLILAAAIASLAFSNTPAEARKQPSCKQWGTIKSRHSKTPLTVTFVNRTNEHRGVTWINFEGTPVDYAGLNPGETFQINTFLSHPWMFTDGPGNCMEMYLPRAGDSVFEITKPSPGFGPGND
jgi:hypothetical protein